MAEVVRIEDGGNGFKFQVSSDAYGTSFKFQVSSGGLRPFNVYSLGQCYSILSHIFVIGVENL